MFRQTSRRWLVIAFLLALASVWLIIQLLRSSITLALFALSAILFLGALVNFWHERFDRARWNNWLEQMHRAVKDRAEVAAWILFALALVVYAATRLIALDQFPIYFFADEALESVLAQQLIDNGLRDYQGHFFPFFFNTYGFFNPLISVYFHAISVALFGKSIIITRATSAMVTLIGSGAAGLLLKFGLRVRFWWLAPLFLAATPAWFLHSRTAFETAMMVSFYACFLLFYVLYRERAIGFAYLAVICAAATFYSYGNGQLVIGATGILLLLSDLRYHLKNWRALVPVAILIVVLALPYYQFRQEHSDEAAYHLRTLNAYWLRDIPVGEKIAQFFESYVYGSSPGYWFIPNEEDLARHRVDDYGQIAWWALPWFALGIGVCLARVRSSTYRVLIIAALAAPIGGALTAPTVTRMLAFVIPASLFCALALDALLVRLRNIRIQWSAAVIAFAVLAFASFAMLNDALTNGELWFRDYGLYGMQWGAKQLFAIIPEYLRVSPDTRILITPTWANGTEVFLEYFMPGESRVMLANIDSLLEEKRTLDDSMLWIMTPAELARAQDSQKFKLISIERTLAYPDGTAGFYFARLDYADNADELFAAETIERRQPVTEQILLNGEIVTLVHPPFDAGQSADLFDGDPFTLARGQEANPFWIEFYFPTPRRVTRLVADLGSMDFTLTVALFATDQSEPIQFTRTWRNPPLDPQVEMVFDHAPPRVTKIRIEIHDLNAGSNAKIHIREIIFK